MAKNNDKPVKGKCSKCGSTDFYKTIGNPQCWQCDTPLKESVA